MLSLGLGLTNACNLRCAHCYRDDQVTASLTETDVQEILDALEVRSVNLGTGENGLHPQFTKILSMITSQVPKTTITSNGYTAAMLTDAALQSFANVEFSVDFPTPEEQDQFRGRGNWELVRGQTARCRALGIPVTITAVMMSTNYDRLDEVARVAAQWDATFRVNIYQPVQGDAYSLTYEQLWTSFANLLEHTQLVTTTEPVLAAALGFTEGALSGCGRTTVRVSPEGRVLPCVYVPGADLGVAELVAAGNDIVQEPAFADFRSVPVECMQCDALAVCGGGCAGRRTLVGAPKARDPYCPKIGAIRLTHVQADVRDLPKAGSACTSIFQYMV